MRLPFATYALRDVVLVLLGGLLLSVGAGAAAVTLDEPLWWLALVIIVPIAAIWVSAYRDPHRDVNRDEGVVLSPADGVVADIADLPERFSGNPLPTSAVRIGIAIGLLDVHVTRAPEAAHVLSVQHRPGKKRGARHEAASAENEANSITLDVEGLPDPIVVRQQSCSTGRKIVCQVRPGQHVRRGERLGGIKLGSRTELYLPKPSVGKVLVAVGMQVKGAVTPLAEIRQTAAEVAAAKARAGG